MMSTAVRCYSSSSSDDRNNIGSAQLEHAISESNIKECIQNLKHIHPAKSFKARGSNKNAEGV